MIIEIAAALALLLGIVLAKSPLGKAIKTGLCEGTKLGIQDARRHPQDGKTLEELEDKGPILPEIQNPGSNL